MSNVLPATGPVAAKGDQGRDFETFRTYLRDELGTTGAFLGLASGEVIVFACTIQKGHFPAKLLEDCNKICTGGEAVDTIYSFCTTAVPIGERHELQAQVASSHNVQLEIFDLYALAEQLADADTFWIAERYLSLPAELRPARSPLDPTEPDWYSAIRERWRHFDRPTGLGELLELKTCLHHCTFVPAARRDLPFWLEHATNFVCEEASLEVRQRARYEIAVASFRGQGRFRAVEPLIQDFFEEIDECWDPALLRDATTLIRYCGGALLYSFTDLEPSAVRQWAVQLGTHLKALLDIQTNPNWRATLLDLIGRLTSMMDPLRTPVMTATPPHIDAIFNREEIVKSYLGQNVPATEGEFIPISVDQTIDVWTELVSILEQAPLFPIDFFAEQVARLAPFIVDRPEYPGLVEGLDAVVAERAGKAAAGRQCHERAIALYEASRLTAAVRELHRAKIDWWAGDNVRGALQVMLFLSSCYWELGLPLAAKQYALAVSASAEAFGEDYLREFVSEALFRAAQCDYLNGAWCSATDFFEAGLLVHQQYIGNIIDPEEFSDLGIALHYQTLILYTALEALPELGERLRTRLDELRLDKEFDLALKHIRTTQEVPFEQWINEFEHQLCNPPFSDLGTERVITFEALGVTWTFRCENSYAHVVAMEGILAVMQVFLADLAEADLCLLPTTSEIFVTLRDGELGDQSNESIERHITKEVVDSSLIWRVALPRCETCGSIYAQAWVGDAARAVLALMLDVSLLSTEDFAKAYGASVERGLFTKLFAARPYDQLAAVATQDQFDQLGRNEFEVPFSSLKRRPTHRELAWQSGPGPTYSTDKAQVILKDRYENALSVLTRTLAQVRDDDAFLETIGMLRAKGWLDWHILNVLFNVRANMRLRVTPFVTSAGLDISDKEALIGFLNRPESDADPPLPLAELSEEAMDRFRSDAMLVSLQKWDLELRQMPPDVDAVGTLLASRYGYWTDDVDHDDPFPTRW